MSRLSMNELTTYRWSFEEDVQHYAEAGIEALGVWRDKLTDFGAEKGIELLSDSGLVVSSLLWAGGFTGSDGRTHQDSVEDAREAIRLASRLKAGCLIVYSGARGGHTHNHARRLLRSALDALVPLAAEARVPLTLEPMHAGCAAEWTFLTDLDETLELLNEYDNPYLKMAFDTYHMGHDEAVVDRLPEIASQIGIVQLGDARTTPQGEQNRCRLGDGVIDLPQIIGKLCSAGYEGFFDVELMGEDIEASDYRELLRHSQEAYASLLDVAKTKEGTS